MASSGWRRSSETLNNEQTVLMYQFAAQAVNMDFDATSVALKTA